MIRLHPRVVDALLVVLALADVWATHGRLDEWGDGSALLAAAALIARRRWPLPVFALTLPALLVTGTMVASLIALYTLASSSRARVLVATCAVAFGVCYALPWPAPTINAFGDIDFGLSLIYTTALAAAPALLGQLAQARRDLAQRLVEVAEAQEQERLLAEQNALARERAQLAREMHDVVSHQISLIAVRAGVLQVGTSDPELRESATTIRRLSVNTLDELRHMVTVLRASGSPPAELTPQPTLAQLEQLIAASSVPASLDMNVAEELSPAAQRAIYRTVQEALTNVRKHAPGASAQVHIWSEGSEINTTITNSPPTRPVLELPSAQHGLIGLRERAELLNGTVHSAPTEEGGYLVHLRLPQVQQSV